MSSWIGIERVEITRLGQRAYLENVEEGNDGRRTHYWIKYNTSSNHQVAEGTDIWAVRSNRISITPLDPALMHGELPTIFNGLADEVATGLGLRKGG